MTLSHPPSDETTAVSGILKQVGQFTSIARFLLPYRAGKQKWINSYSD